MLSLKQIYLLIIFSCIFCIPGKSQNPILKKEAPKSLLKKYKKASSISGPKRLIKQEIAFKKILDKNPTFVDPYIDLAYIYYQTGRINDARALLEKAIELAPDYKAKHYLILANYCKELKDLSCEKRTLNSFLSISQSEKQIKLVEARLKQMEIREEMMKDFEHIELTRLPTTINSLEHAEYFPVLNTEGNTLIFTRRINGQEDFYKSELLNGKWSEAVAVQSLNTPGNEGVHAISADNKWIIFTKCDAPKRYKSCDLYIAKNLGLAWGEPNYMANINTTSWESQPSFSPDGNTIYFSSNRDGGNGGRDLYYVEYINGTWSKPINMGDIINTKKQEEAPFMHPDGQTLYFMSNGHPGLGGSDLFVTTKSFDGSWTEPLNLGPAINSEKDEGGLFVELNGERAFFSKTEKIKREDGTDNLSNSSLINSDIFSFPLPNKFKPKPTSYVKFNVTNALDGTPIEATINIDEITSKKTRKENIPKTGLPVVVTQNEKYNIIIEKEGFIYFSEQVQFKEKSLDPILYTIQLMPIVKEVETLEKPIVTRMRNIEFESGEAELLTSSFPEIDRLVKLMEEQQSIKIILNGHTDNVGNEEDNLILSRRRAEAVQNYLINKNIDSSRIEIRAFGESRPILDNDSEENRAMNRRIEFEIVAI